MMKKMIVSTLIVMTIFMTIPAKKAEAGIFVTATGAGIAVDEDITAGSVVMISGLSLMQTGFVLPAITNHTIHMFNIAILLVVLDADSEQTVDDLSLELANRYSFIDDQNVISSLASEILTEYSQKKGSAQGAYVNISSEKVLSILASADLSVKEIEQVVNDLK